MLCQHVAPLLSAVLNRRCCRGSFQSPFPVQNTQFRLRSSLPFPEYQLEGLTCWPSGACGARSGQTCGCGVLRQSQPVHTDTPVPRLQSSGEGGACNNSPPPSGRKC